jgi:hypothetical protein
LALLVITSSCVTRQRCENRFGKCGNIENQIIYEKKDSIIYRPGIDCIDTVHISQIEYLTTPIVIRDTLNRVTTTIAPLSTRSDYFTVKTVVKRDTIIIPKIVEKITATKQITCEEPSNFWKIVACVLAVVVLFESLLLSMR